jgi:IS605 OrfB family transposase
MTSESVAITIPGYLHTLTETEQTALDELFRDFGTARRRAYQLQRRGARVPDMEKFLSKDHYLNGRYAKDAIYSVRELPSHVTFGGLRNQRLREQGKNSKEEYKTRRNALLLARGEKMKQGNLNLRLNLQDMTLRITCPRRSRSHRWIYPKIFIPSKYLAKYQRYLTGGHPYLVVLKRRDNDAGFDVCITIMVECPIKDEAKRLLTLDVNAGHTAFAVVDKQQGQVLALGPLNHYETQYTRRTRRDELLHQMTGKIGNLAHHYDAEVVVGHLNTGKYKANNKQATRKVRQMPQYKFRQILRHQLTRRGIQVTKRSEAYTSKLGKELAEACGLDVHKCAAALFALKVGNYPLFRQLKTLILSKPENSSDDGDGSPRRSLAQRVLRELTAPHPNRRFSGKNRVKFWWAMRLAEEDASNSANGGDPVIPGNWGRSFLESLFDSTFAHHQLKIC